MSLGNGMLRERFGDRGRSKSIVMYKCGEGEVEICETDKDFNKHLIILELCKLSCYRNLK